MHEGRKVGEIGRPRPRRRRSSTWPPASRSARSRKFTRNEPKDRTGIKHGRNRTRARRDRQREGCGEAGISRAGVHEQVQHPADPGGPRHRHRHPLRRGLAADRQPAQRPAADQRHRDHRPRRHDVHHHRRHRPLLRCRGGDGLRGRGEPAPEPRRDGPSLQGRSPVAGGRGRARRPRGRDCHRGHQRLDDHQAQDPALHRHAGHDDVRPRVGLHLLAGPPPRQPHRLLPDRRAGFDPRHPEPGHRAPGVRGAHLPHPEAHAVGPVHVRAGEQPPGGGGVGDQGRSLPHAGLHVRRLPGGGGGDRPHRTYRLRPARASASATSSTRSPRRSSAARAWREGWAAREAR